jgi:hypothetical protein
MTNSHTNGAEKKTDGNRPANKHNMTCVAVDKNGENASDTSLKISSVLIVVYNCKTKDELE